MIFVGLPGYKINSANHIYSDNSIDKLQLIRYAKKFNFIELNQNFDITTLRNNITEIADISDHNMSISLQSPKTVTHSNINNSNISENLKQAKALAAQYANLNLSSWLGPIVFEFPFSFQFSKANIVKVKSILDIFSEYKRVVEFNHNSWVCDETYEFLSANKTALCLRDTPEIEDVAGSANFQITSNFAYIKFYGRSSANWWQPLDISDKTDYLYSRKELKTWQDKILKKFDSQAVNIYMSFYNIKNLQCYAAAEYFIKANKIKPAIESDQFPLKF